MKTKIVTIDALAAVCNHFTEQTDIGNSYGCNHPEQAMYDECYTDENGFTRYPDEEHPATGKQGKCFASECPIAHLCEREDLEKYAPDRLDDFGPDEDVGDAELVAYHYEDGDEIGERL